MRAQYEAMPYKFKIEQGVHRLKAECKLQFILFRVSEAKFWPWNLAIQVQSESAR